MVLKKMIMLMINSSVFNRIWAHLLRSDTKLEQAAFLFCKTKTEKRTLYFHVIEEKIITSNDIEIQTDYYFELKKHVYRNIVERASKLDASIVELHSHTSEESAEFSFTDKSNLKNTIDYLSWRLDDRPYMAIVASQNDFDALVWTNGEKKPKPLTGLIVEDEVISPTNNTMEYIDS